MSDTIFGASSFCLHVTVSNTLYLVGDFAGKLYDGTQRRVDVKGEGSEESFEVGAEHKP